MVLREWLALPTRNTSRKSGAPLSVVAVEVLLLAPGAAVVVQERQPPHAIFASCFPIS